MDSPLYSREVMDSGGISPFRRVLRLARHRSVWKQLSRQQLGQAEPEQQDTKALDHRTQHPTKRLA